MLLGLAHASAFGQTCTITGTGTVNWSAISCSEGGGTAGKSTLVIPANLTVVNTGQNWTGTTIEVNGVLEINSTVTLNSSIMVNNGGVMNVHHDLMLGGGGACPYRLVVYTGGTVNIDHTGTAQIDICSTDVILGNGNCDNCGGSSSAQCPLGSKPYCAPSGGITGPTGYDDTGYNPALPVKLLYFNAEPDASRVELSWATSQEENFYKFIIQRSGQGLEFEELGEVEGKGFNIHDTETRYSFADQMPLSGFNYYRLKAVDVDESVEYFGVKAVKVDGVREIAVYPNPASGQVISFRTNFSPGEADRVIVTNGVGVEIFNAAASTLQNRILLPQAPGAGIYTLRYIGHDFEESARVVFKD